MVNERIVEATHKAGGAKRFIFTTVSHDVAKVRRRDGGEVAAR